MNDERRRIRNGSEFEREYGYCRAVRAGSLIMVSGTTAPHADRQPDVASQYESACAVIGAALVEAGASLSDVVRTVVYVRDLSDLPALSIAHKNAFGSAEPASTIVEVSRLTPDAALVEIEVTAVIG